jgi:Protein of unknown function (DUF1353)
MAMADVAHRTRRGFLYLVAACAVSMKTTLHAQNVKKGEFVGSVKTEWGGDGRNMTLLGPFEYIDPSGRRWPVPSGTVVDGASIPQPFWSVIGGPFEGPYRDASVIHDFYCQVRTRKAVDVHMVFRDAMLTAGVGERKAWLMWKAVDQFGPRWKDPNVDPKCEIIDEKYDFKRCARNSPPPSIEVPELRKIDLEKFLSNNKQEIDPADALVLEIAIKHMKF